MRGHWRLILIRAASIAVISSDATYSNATILTEGIKENSWRNVSWRRKCKGKREEKVGEGGPSGVFGTLFYLIMQVDPMHVFQLCIQQHHVGSLKLVILGIFISCKLWKHYILRAFFLLKSWWLYIYTAMATPMGPKD